MRSVEVPIGLRRLCLERLGDLVQIPRTKEGKRDGKTLARFARDTETANGYALQLLEALAGFQAEPEDAHAARVELSNDALEALSDSAQWLEQRKAENWT